MHPSRRRSLLRHTTRKRRKNCDIRTVELPQSLTTGAKLAHLGNSVDCVSSEYGSERRSGVVVAWAIEDDSWKRWFDVSNAVLADASQLSW
jgi:hypothetical protein